MAMVLIVGSATFHMTEVLIQQLNHTISPTTLNASLISAARYSSLSPLRSAELYFPTLRAFSVLSSARYHRTPTHHNSNPRSHPHLHRYSSSSPSVNRNHHSPHHIHIHIPHRNPPSETADPPLAVISVRTPHSLLRSLVAVLCTRCGGYEGLCIRRLGCRGCRLLRGEL